MSCIAKTLGFRTVHGGDVKPRKFIRPVDSPSWIVNDWCDKHFKELKKES